MVLKTVNHLNTAELKERGWTVFDSDANPGSLLQIAHSLGTPVPPKAGDDIFSWLTPSAHTAQHRKTFSGIFGRGKFPLHTDTAHWPEPARYLILCDLGKSHDRPTTVLQCDQILASLSDSDAGHAVWKVSGPKGYFPCSLTFSDGDEKGFRYDPLCMMPMNQSAKSVCDSMDNLQLEPQEISWRYGRTVVFDNWRVLHGRGDSKCDDAENRTLLRILISKTSY